MYRQSLRVISQRDALAETENRTKRVPGKPSSAEATSTGESPQRVNSSEPASAGESSQQGNNTGDIKRPTSAMSRHSLQSPLPGVEEGDPTPEGLIQNNPNYLDTLPLLESMIEGCQKCLNNPKKANLESYVQTGSTYVSTHVRKESPGQIFMTEYLAVKEFIPMSKQLYDMMLQKAKITNLMQWELEAEGGPFSNTEVIVALMMSSVWWNTSDASQRIARKLATTTIYEDLIGELRGCEEENHTKASFTISFQSCVNILHNCAKETSVRQLLRESQLVEVLVPYLKVENAKAQMVVLLTLGLIIDESQNHLLFSDEKAFDMILQYTQKAHKSPDHRHGGFQVEELVVGICNLAKNEPNKKILVNKGVLDILEPILRKGTDVEKQVAAEAVLELAFDPYNQTKIKGMTGYMEILEDLMTSSHRGICKAAQGAMWLLSPEKIPKGKKKQRHQNMAQDQTVPGSPVPIPGGVPPPAPPPPMSERGIIPSAPSPCPPPPPPPGIPPAPVDKQGGHIMISYSWTEQKLLLQVRDALREQGLQVWMDVDDMGGSTLQAMAEAVEESDVVLICLSQSYKESQNCRIEAEYAFQRHKRIVPLKVERGYTPNGWLGIICGAKLFFDFSGKYPFVRKMEELVREINHKPRDGPTDTVDAPIKSQVAPVLKKEPAAAAGGVAVAAWKSEDVVKWVKNIGLAGNKKLEIMSGEDLEFLKDLSSRAPEYYFNVIEHKLGLASLQAIRLFSNAVDRLP